MSDLKPATTQDKLTKEREPDPHTPPPQAETAQTRSATVLALVALAFCIGLAVTAYFTWNQLQQLLGQQAGLGGRLDDAIGPLRSSVQEISHQAQLERQQAETRAEQLAEEQQSLGHRVSVLAALLGRSEQGWGLSEVEYLLRIANHRLLLQRDVKTAKVALRSADARLRELADPHYLGVREQIAAELEALEAVPSVDAECIYAGIQAWLVRIDELPVAGTDYEPPDKAGAARPQTSAVTDWRELPALIWTSLSELFRLREHDQPIEPMLPPERGYFLRENLRLQLASAQLALLRDDPGQYRGALDTARRWVSAYFAKDSTDAAALAAQLEELAEINIRPELPEISASLRLLRRQMTLSEQQTVLPVVPQAPAAAPSASEGEQESNGASAP
jgi:uroporphyrin-3 C-methyltransferase